MAKNTPKKSPQASRADQKASAQARRTARQEKAARAAAALKAQQQSRKRRERLIVGGVVVALLAIIGIGWFVQDRRDAARADADVPANAVDEFALGVGDPEAPHTLEIYEDFLCPSCATFEQTADSALEAAAEDGQVYVKYLPFELLDRFGDYSKESANAFAVVLDESGPEVAKEFHDLLYADQPSESGPFPDTDWLVEKAVEAGAEEDAVRPGIEDMVFEDWVANATSNALDDNDVGGTPTVRLDGEDVEGDSYDEMLQNILDAVA